MSRITTRHLRQFAAEGRKFACLTAYDATFARVIDEAGVDVILVGDSLGNVLQGHDTTVPVTVDDMAYHIGCVRRGTQSALIIGDLPFMSYATPEQALDNAAVVMQAGAHVVKLEGGAWLLDTIRLFTERGIPVCAHLGLTPQSVNLFGGFRVQGRQPDSARTILADAQALAAAGAALLVLECVPRDLARRITEAVDIPVIGIGAGPDTDGQVLVLHDMLGLNPHPARFVRDFVAEGGSIPGAIRAYAEAVRNGTFPAAEHCFE